MKKLPSLFLLLSFLVLACAAPAVAQSRDPFDPADQSEASTPSEGTSGDSGPADSSGDTTSPSDSDVEPVTSPTDALPVTGSDPSLWLVTAYGLIASGGALLLLHGLRRPVRVR